MGDAQVKGASHHGAGVFEDIDAAEIVPEAERNRGQLQSAASAAAIQIGVIITGGGGDVRHGKIIAEI